jgi:hypothetical protein
MSRVRSFDARFHSYVPQVNVAVSDAAARGDLATMRQLIADAGPTFNIARSLPRFLARDYHWTGPLDAAVSGRHFPVIKFLIEELDVFTGVSLEAAARARDQEMVDAILRSKAELFSYAAPYGADKDDASREAAFKFALERFLSMHDINKHSVHVDYVGGETIHTLLTAALHIKLHGVARWLILHGADVNLGEPLRFCESDELARMMLARGASPLALASVELRLAAGVPPTDDELISAAQRGDRTSVMLLLAGKADPHAVRSAPKDLFIRAMLVAAKGLPRQGILNASDVDAARQVIENAQVRIRQVRRSLVDERALEICVALQNLGLPESVSALVLSVAIPLSHLAPTRRLWSVAVAVKKHGK